MFGDIIALSAAEKTNRKEWRKNMIQIINNTVNASAFTIPASSALSGVAVVKGVKPIYELDSEGKRTENVIAVKYDLIDADNFNSFSVKVPGAKPVITSEELEVAQGLVLVELPVERMKLRAYSIEFGRAKVSVSADVIRRKE